MAKTIKELEDSIRTKDRVAQKAGGGFNAVYERFKDSLTPEELEHHEKKSSTVIEKPSEHGNHLAKQNKDNYYNNIAYIAEVMVYVKFVAIVTIIMWALSAIGIFIVFAQ